MLSRSKGLTKLGKLWETAKEAKGESADELRGFVRGMLELGRGPLPSRPATLADTCGTGGDGSNSFNLSSAAALLTAALGVPVANEPHPGLDLADN